MEVGQSLFCFFQKNGCRFEAEVLERVVEVNDGQGLTGKPEAKEGIFVAVGGE